jgi:hypothetical protein
MTPLIDDETATRYWSERDTAPEAERESRNAALIDWAKAKKADQFRAEQQQAESAYTDLDGWWKENGAGHVFEKDEDRLEVANRRFIANQFQQTPDQQGRYYPTYRDEYLQKTFGKSGLSETDTFNLIRDSLTARKETEAALRELPGALAKEMFSKIGEGKPFDEHESPDFAQRYLLFQDWKDRHADKLGKLPEGWESAMLDRAVKLQDRAETMMRDLAPESKRAFDTLMAFTRPEDAAGLPPANRADVENIAKEFAKLTPEDRQNIYSTLYYAAEADGAGMGKGFFEKIGEGIARGGVNIYNDAEMTAQDRQARQNISEFQSLLDKPEQQPGRMQTAQSIQMQRDLAQKGVEENTQRLAELKALREIRQIADGTIDPIKTEMDGVIGSIVQGAYDFSQSAAYTGMAMIPYVGVPAVMGALTNSNYLRMLDAYPDMDADAALAISAAIAAPQAFIERFQGRALVGKSSTLNSLMKKMTDVRIPIAGRLAIGYGANVAYQTVQEWAQEAMPVAADQLAAAIREDMPEFDAEKAWGAYREQMPDIFFSMLWGGLIGTGTSTFREFKRNGQFERSLGELEMQGVTGEAAQDIAAEQDLDAANTKFREAWDKRTPEDIQAGIAKRAAQLEAARSTQQNPELPVRRIEENADGTLTHIIEKPDGTVLYRTNDSDAADTAFVNITGMVGRSQLTGTTRGIVESLQFIDQVNQAAGRGEDVQKLLLDDAPRNLLDEYEANPTEQNLNNLFETVRSQGQDINEPAELANFPVLASNQGALVDGVFRSIIKIQDGATGDKVMRDFSQDNLKRAIAEGRITMDWVRENLNQVIPLIESERNTGPALRTETDTDVIESFSDVAVAYMTGRIREEQIPQGFRGFLRRMAIIVKDIFRRAYRLKRAIAEGKVDSNFEGFLAESVGLNQQTMVDTTRERASGDIITNGGQMLMDFSLGSRASAVSTDTPSIRASNATITGPANYSIGAFHGTPHKVDKFSLDKIGIGEGAQAYGWGLYFAENITVAENYARGYRPDHLNTPERVAAEALRIWRGNVENAIDDIKANDISGITLTPEMQSSAVDLLKRGERPKSGNLYTVELDVDDADLLDWDKPLSEQSEKVLNALDGIKFWNNETQSFDIAKNISSTGGEAYFDLQSRFNNSPKTASDRFLKAGIPGIRYLDGGSRSVNATDDRLLELAEKNNGNKEAAVDEFMRSVYDTPKAKEKMRSDLLRNFPERTSNYVVFDENLIKITEENGNRIPASQALAAPATGATNYSIGMTVAPLRRDSLSELNKKEMQKRASSAKFIHLQQVIDDVANAYGVKIESRQPVIGGWVESGQISLEVPEAILFDTDDLEMAQEMAAIVGASAPELQNAVMLWKDDDAGKDTVLEFQAKGADSALAVAKDLNAAGLNGFTYDTKSRKFSLVLAGLPTEAITKVYDYINDQSATGNISTRGGTQARAGVAAFPSESDYRGYLQGARSRADLLQQGQREALLDVVDRAERRVDRYAAALKISEQAKKIQKKLKRPSTSALAIESELKGKQFDNIRQLGLYLDARFNKVFGKPSFEIGGQEGIDIASDAFVYDIIDGLAGDGSGMGWYDERVQETIRELSKLHPEFATDSNALAVYIGILATTSQGYTVVENFKQANKVYNEYKRTGRIPTDFKFAKSSDPINSNLAQIQGLIDEHGLDGYAEFMDQEVTGQALRDQFGKTPTGVTLKDTVRGNRVLGPKIGSFFNNLRGQFDTITMDLWYTRTMHRFLGETVVPLDSDKMQKAITKFREELKKDGVRTYGIDLTEALKDDEATVQAALTLFQRWARGDNDYTEKGYFKFPDGYKIEKAARGIFSIGGMKGAPQNKTHRQYFAKVVLEAKAKLAKLGMKLTEADMQAIIWYREKNLFARTGVANAAAKPADYLDAVMVARSGAQVQEDVDPADLEAEDGDTNYSIASQSEIDRVNKALGGMNRGPDERLKVYERAKQKFSKLMSWNSDELGAMADTGSDETQIRRNQLLQGFGELDAILQVLPPEVRGRVGGYTVLANIAPMDVFKDGVKVSESKNMDGAIISAWMKEGQNIGQAGKQVSLPPGYTAKENLASKRADKALADFFRDRIKKIDTELEKVLVREYTEAITKAVKQSRPKAGDNGVRKSTLGAETQKFADMVQRATLLDDEATPRRMAEIEAALANPDATAEDISALSEEWSILNTFGDLDNRSSETLAQGLDWLKGQLQMGREAWRIKEQARIDEQQARAAATIEWLGKSTAKKRFADKGLMQRIAEVGNNYLLDHASFEQFVTAMLPPEIAANFSERLRKADMAAQSSEIRDGKGILDAVREGAKAANMSAGDAMLWLKGDQKNAVAYLEGRKVKDERIAIELAQKIVTGEADRSKLTDADIETLRNELATLPADTQKEFVTIKRVIFRGEDVKLDMSRAKAIQLLLSWNQPDVQIKMRKEGWTDESATDLKALVNDPVSRSVVSYLQSLYGKGAGIVNPVYSRMFGMTMPQVKNYAPTRFLNAKDSKDIGLDGSPTATGTTPGFAKTRVTHSAKIAPEDALTVAQGHIAQQAHWVHFAELAREFRALLSSPEVRESLKQKHGDAVLKSAELWADQLEQRGGNKARESAWLNPILGTVLSGKAVSSLGFSLKTLAMQLDNTIRFGLALDMRQIVSALSNPSTIVEDIQTVWESDAIQNRLQGGATAEARFLFSRYAGKPNFGAKIAEASMTPINWLDSAATSISSAIVYRANLNDALAAGMPENLAKQAALDAASQAIYRFAQPVSFGQKSIMENNGNVLAKTFFLFMSDPRLKTAILADAARGLATGQGNANEHIRRILVVETMAVLSHVVASAFRDVFSDDDDEEIWNLGGFAKAILLAPLQGFFFAGTVGELAISKLTGQKTFNSSTQNPLLSAMEQAVRAGNNLDDVFNLDDPDAMLKEWNNIFRSMALAPWLAAPAVLLNMVKPVYGLYQNATTED